MILIFNNNNNNNIENKQIFNHFELELLKKINIKETDIITDTLTKTNKYICEKYNISAPCFIDNEIDEDDSKLLILKDKIYKYSTRLT